MSERKTAGRGVKWSYGTRQTGLVSAFWRRYFKARLKWQYGGRPRIGRITWLANRMAWPLWCRLCGTDGPTIVREIGRRSRGPLRFVQIGANDGVNNDPLSATVRAHRWSGVLVEPVPRMLERLVANYEGVPGLRFANVAIGPEEGTTTFYTVEGRPGEPAWADQISSLDRDVVLRHTYGISDLESRIVPIEIESVPLPSLVARYGLDSIDLLHVDAEGYDYEIVSQVQAGATWAPRYILFEVKHMGFDRWKVLKPKLRRAGYRFVNVWPDMFAYRERP